MFGRLAGYEDLNDAERLRHDPAMRWIVGGRAALGAAASPSQMGRFETRWLTAEKNLSARYQGKVSRIYFRADAGFANPEVYEYLEAERIKYAIRLPANRVLQERIGYLLQRPVGRPSNDVRRSYANFTYQAGSWNKPRRHWPRSRVVRDGTIHRHQSLQPVVKEAGASYGRDQAPLVHCVPTLVRVPCTSVPLPLI